MFKKVLGILAILVGLFLTVSTLSQGFLMIRSLVQDTGTQNSAYTVGFIIGQSITLILFLVAAFFLFKRGIKWFRAKK